MFGKNLPNDSAISVSIKLRIGAGHPLIAWSGSSQTPDHEVIEDISRNSAVAKYVSRAIDRGKIKTDEMGCISLPAFLCVLQDKGEAKEQIDEHKIELILALAAEGEQSNTVLFDKLFSCYAQSMEKLAQFYNQAITEGCKTIATSAKESAAILTAIADPLKSSLGLIEKVYLHESTRADEAHAAIVTMLSDGKNKESVLDDAAKVIAIGAAVVGLVEKVKKVN